MVLRYKSYMNRLRIGLPFLEPEKSPFAVAKARAWLEKMDTNSGGFDVV